jgi:hypothetical protein
MRLCNVLTSTALALTLTRCAPPPPAPAPTPPPPPPPAAPTPAPANWQDAPLTSGSWRYQAGEAIFSNGTGGPAIFRIRCNAQRRTVAFVPATPAAAGSHQSITITTTYAARTIAAVASSDRATAEIAAFDSFLDGVAYSRGRIMIALPTGERLILPAWPEIARVIEDCRE